MLIKVKNNNPMHAYRILMKRMNKDADYKNLRLSTHYESKASKRRRAEHAGRRRWKVKREKIEARLIRKDTEHLRRKKRKK